jgi:hypothetical protein
VALVHDPTVSKLGKAAPKPSKLQIRDYIDVEGALAQAPASVVNSGSPPGSYPLAMYGNDTLGDCTCAGVGNTLRVNSKDADRLPEQAIVDAYVAVTTEEGDPYNPATGANADAGCAEIDVLDYWVKSGIGGNKLVGHAGVNMQDADEVKSVCWLFGSVYPGWQLSIAQQSQQVWDVATGRDGRLGSWGGHCAPIFDITPSGALLGTWGAYKQATLAFIPWCADEGHALVTDQWLADNQSNPLVNTAQLEADLKQLQSEGRPLR